MGKMRFVGDVSSVVVNDVTGKGPQDVDAPVEDDGVNPEYEQGYQTGWNERDQQAQGEIQELTEQVQKLQRQVNNIANKLPAAMDEYLAVLEEQAIQEVCDVGFEVAKILVGRIAEENADIIESILREALPPTLDPTRLTLRLHPKNAKAYQAAAGGNGPQVVVDKRLNMGEVMIDSDQGVLDGTLPSRLGKLRGVLDKKLANPPQEENGEE